MLPFLVLFVGVTLACAQQAPPVPRVDPEQMNQRLLEMAQSSPASRINEYRIGPEDLLEISVFEVPELSRTARVSISGEISLPMLRAVKVGGLTPVEAEQLLRDKLKETYVKDPQVTVFVREFKSDPVSVVGAVKMSGLQQIQTSKTLIEVLAMAQGFSEGPTRLPGRTIIITRKPRPGATSAQADITEVPIKQLLESGDPKWNVPVYPGDVVKVVQAGTVYVAGDVVRPGAFPLVDFDNISAVQALAMAGGTTKSASRRNASILSRDASGARVERKIDLKRVLQGKDPDTTLGPNDILFVPGSVGKESALRAIEASIQLGTGLLIWRR